MLKDILRAVLYVPVTRRYYLGLTFAVLGVYALSLWIVTKRQQAAAVAYLAETVDE